MADLERVTVLAHSLIAHYLGEGQWSFGFDHAKRRAGQCNYTHQRITVSRYLAAKFSEEEVQQILLHEIAHAIAGSRAGHGPRWRETAARLGYTGGRLHDGGVAEELAPWVGTCPAGHEVYRFRRPTRAHSCSRCARGFSPAHQIRWVSRNPGSTTSRASR